MAYDKIKFKKGLRAHLPQQADIGEPLYCTDTNELFIGTGEGCVPVGIVGPIGEKGEPGLNGLNGLDGRDGARGPEGPKGERGDQGPQGIRGERGERGPKGDNGLNGRDGIDGVQGERGPQGSPGPTGPQGIIGPRGPKGDDGKSVSIKGQKNSVNELPTATAEAGDGWLINGDLYVWDADSNLWINVGRIQGPQGIKGDTGAQGPAGPVHISDDTNSQNSTTAASSKAVYTINTKITTESNKKVAKTGDSMTGNLEFTGTKRLIWNCGRANKSSVFWNASAQNDYGMVVEVDGQQQFLVKKNVKPQVYINGAWQNLVTQNDLNSIDIPSGGDFVGKKVFYRSFSNAIPSKQTSSIFTLETVGKENIISVGAIFLEDDQYSQLLATLTIDDQIIASNVPVKNMFLCNSIATSGYSRSVGGNFINFPFSKNFRLQFTNNTAYVSKPIVTAYHYYKQ